jgi:UDP-perosamine 4-acetyltransferase
VIDALLAAGTMRLWGVLDPHPSPDQTDVLGVPIKGDDGRLAEAARDGVTHFAVGVGSVGDSRLRRNLNELGIQHGLIPITVRHPAAVCAPSAQVGQGCQLLAGCVINARAVLGGNVIVNTRAVVEHDCRIGDDVHLAPGAVVCGGVRIEAGAHIGAGATVCQNLLVGARAVVGAGAAVVRDVPAAAVVAGVPARVLKDLS